MLILFKFLKFSQYIASSFCNRRLIRLIRFISFICIMGATCIWSFGLHSGYEEHFARLHLLFWSIYEVLNKFADIIVDKINFKE